MPSDLSWLLDRHPFLFERMTEEQAADLLERLSLEPKLDETLLQLTANRSPRESPESLAWHEVIKVYREAIEACADKGPHAVAEILEQTDWIADRLLDAWSHGETLGEQRASRRFRFPGLVPQLPGIQLDRDLRVKLDMRRMRQMDRFGYMQARRAIREYEETYKALKALLGSKAHRRANAKALLQEVRGRFPELARPGREAAKLISRAPREAALHVWSRRRYGRTITASRAQQLLDEARDALAAWNRRLSRRANPSEPSAWRTGGTAIARCLLIMLTVMFSTPALAVPPRATMSPNPVAYNNIGPGMSGAITLEQVTTGAAVMTAGGIDLIGSTPEDAVVAVFRVDHGGHVLEQVRVDAVGHLPWAFGWIPGSNVDVTASGFGFSFFDPNTNGGMDGGDSSDSFYVAYEDLDFSETLRFTLKGAFYELTGSVSASIDSAPPTSCGMGGESLLGLPALWWLRGKRRRSLKS